jgi:membrane associated rhomboid family serine protease
MNDSGLPLQHCHLHPKRETLRSCNRCGRPTCPECLRDAPVGQHCLACIKEAQGPAAARVKRTGKVTARQFKAMDLPVTRSLIALNAAVFVLTNLMQRYDNYDLAVFAAGADGRGGVANGEWWRLITSGFIHFGIVHIGFNMFALWQLGRVLEPALGRWRYIGLYVVSLLGGAFGALLFQPFGYTGGASGAVFGLAGAATVALRQRGVPFNNTWGPMLLINMVLSLSIRGISLGGHLGGLVFGVIIGAVLMNPKRRGKAANQDLALLLFLGALAVGLAVLVAKSPINGDGLWPRN